MNKIILCFLLCFGFIQAQGQSYFDKSWKPVNTKAEATYYRLVEPVGKKFLVIDYYASTDEKQMKAICSGLDPTPILDGEAAFYYEDGTLQKEGTYSNNKPVGIFKEYYPDGSKMSEMEFQGDNEKYISYWDEAGKLLLEKGNGLISRKEKDADGIEYRAITDSLLVDCYLVRPTQKDTIYYIVDIQSTYEGGQDLMYKQLSRNLVYPRSARRTGTEGKVFIMFLIDKTGRTSEVKILKGVSYDCDQAALNAFASLGSWLPSRKKGKPVKTRFILPVNFKLKR